MRIWQAGPMNDDRYSNMLKT